VNNVQHHAVVDAVRTTSLLAESAESFGFNAVLNALEEFTGQASLALGGWEAEDPGILPPGSLIESLSQIPTRLSGYTYMRELSTAKRYAAELFASDIRMNGKLPTPEHIAILPNSTQALLLTLAVLKDRGVRNVVVAAPSYFAVAEASRHLGLALTIVPAADFVTGAFDIAGTVAAMRRKKSVLIVTNPTYSIGVEYDWVALSLLVSALPQESLVVLDETRLGLNWNDEAPWYRANYPDSVVVIRSPSKIFFINGQKTSLILAAPGIIRAIEQTSEGLLGSVSGVAEPVALAFLACWRQWVDELERQEEGPLRRWRREVIAGFRRNRKAAAQLLQPRGFTLSPVDSGPYLLACRAQGEHEQLDSSTIARTLGVLMMDSSYFFHQHSQWMGFRVNLSNRQEHIAEAIARVFPLAGSSEDAPNKRDLAKNDDVRYQDNEKEQSMTLSLPLLRREPLPLPRELYIESTTRCNEFCDQCPRTHLGREADRDITLAEIRQIVEQFPALDRVVLHGLGEPLLNPELPAIVRYLRTHDVYTLFNSNALLLNEKRGSALIESGLNELRVSLDGATPATYARVRGVNQKALPLILKNLTQFQELKRYLGSELPQVSLWFTAMRENFLELPQVVELAAAARVPEVYVQRFIYFGQGLATEDQALFHAMREQERAALHEAERRCQELHIAFTATGSVEPVTYLGRGTASGGTQPWKGCRRPYSLAYITAHGNVYSCCFAPFTPGPLRQKKLGNVFDTPFERIWNGERYQAFRAAFESDTPWPQCASCGTKWSL
jgi:radical SAM protein with 4Fe4S-binding SPASM domain